MDELKRYLVYVGDGPDEELTLIGDYDDLSMAKAKLLAYVTVGQYAEVYDRETKFVESHDYRPVSK